MQFAPTNPDRKLFIKEIQGIGIAYCDGCEVKFVPTLLPTLFSSVFKKNKLKEASFLRNVFWLIFGCYYRQIFNYLVAFV